ncbi:hypothetical protein [Flavobacterium sp.]|uniref:hypothetical protein n=1 Tax=Flavobacterium sp. TaxID=239 RepID=UPI0026044AC6|nr:hypothetical protein [Flavobacterium sp.]MDD3005366.1 hypothetical protein [Flavobacterium sp.]
MKKWFYFVPYVLYNFLKRKNKNTEFDSYWKSIGFFVLTFIYIPSIFLINSSPFKFDNKIYGMLFMAFIGLLISFIFPRKKLDSLVFTKTELSVANWIVVIYLFAPILFCIAIIIKVLIEGKL